MRARARSSRKMPTAKSCRRRPARGTNLALAHIASPYCPGLNDGRPVPVEVARLVIFNTPVEPAGGPLFRDMPAQTWRYSQ